MVGNVRVLLVATFVAALAGCKSDSPLEPIDRAFRIAAVSAVDFSGVVATIATPAPVVRVTDKDGHPVGDVQVTFSVAAGSGSVNPSLVTTDAEGRASVTWTLGTSASTHTLTASVGTLASVVFTVEAAAGPPTALERAGSDLPPVAAGTVVTSPLTTRIFDSYRNPVAGVSVSFRVISGGGAVTPANAVTDATGAVSASWTLGPVEGVQTVQAEAAGMSVVFTADVFSCPSTPCTGLGELVFVRSGDNQIYRVTVDGKALTKLTSDGFNHYPAWSPDGQRIAFTRFTPGGAAGNSDIYLMNANGSNLVRRTTAGQYYSVAWSPDGRTLIVDGPSGGDSMNIYTVSVDTDEAPKVLITNGASPSWSPDGKKIAYTHGTGYYDASQIYSMNADGTGAHRATPDSVGWNWSPAWSPDGKRISFTRCINNCTIYAMNADGSALTQVTPAFGSQDAEWSPDGRWLVLTVYGASTPSINYVPATGGNPRTILSNAYHPSWRPQSH